MCSETERIEKLFEDTLDMDYEQADKFLSELDEATRDAVMGLIIGNADVYEYGT
jgi:hypothetical protein